MASPRYGPRPGTPNDAGSRREGGLTVDFPAAERERSGTRQVVAGIDFDIHAGRTLGVVGESGCGKSLIGAGGDGAGAAAGPGRRLGHAARGSELLGQPQSAWRSVRGDRIAMVFQEPMTALNPVMPVGRQIAEVDGAAPGSGLAGGRAHARSTRWRRSASPRPSSARRSYPHQLSGGMRQRAMIAMALACRPALLIADEPTTALDVTIQAQILDLMQELQDEIGMAIQFISHNLAVISRDRARDHRDVRRPQSSSGRRPTRCSPHRCTPTRSG